MTKPKTTINTAVKVGGAAPLRTSLAITPIKKAPPNKAVNLTPEATFILKQMREHNVVIELDNEYALSQPKGILYSRTIDGGGSAINQPLILELLSDKTQLQRRFKGWTNSGEPIDPVLIHVTHPKIARWPLTFVLYDDKKSMTKIEVLKLKPGTWIELKNMDSANTIVLLVEKPELYKSVLDLRTFDPQQGEVISVEYEQVVRVAGYVMLPPALNADKNSQWSPDVKPSLLNKLRTVVPKTVFNKVPKKKAATKRVAATASM